jgi:hypothetical protein
LVFPQKEIRAKGMSKKLIAILLIAVAALGITYVVKQNTGISGSNSIHADSALVHKIFIADMAGNTVTAKRTASGEWMLNDSQQCNQYPVQHLLYVLNEAKPTQVVNANLRATVLKDLSVSGITVEAYDKDNKLMRRFTIGGDAVGATRGCYALASTSKDPCVYDILSYDGHFQTQIDAKPLTWRALTIMRFAAADIKQVQVDFANAPDSSFVLQKQGDGKYNIKTAAGTTSNTIEQKRLDAYLGLFADNRCLGFENTNPRAQQILNEDIRYAKVRLTTTSDKAAEYLFIYARADKRAKTTKEFNGVSYNPEFLYCWDGKDLSLTRFDYMSRILCMPSFFL